jgi:xanthine/uracil permease
MGSQLSAALQMIAREKAVETFNSGLIIGFPLMVALLIAFAPEAALAQLPSLIRPILGNGFVMGTITVLFLEHIVFKEEK